MSFSEHQAKRGIVDGGDLEGKRRLPVEDVYRQLYNGELYLEAYGRLCPNQGEMMKGIRTEIMLTLAVPQSLAASVAGYELRALDSIDCSCGDGGGILEDSSSWEAAKFAQSFFA